ISGAIKHIRFLIIDTTTSPLISFPDMRDLDIVLHPASQEVRALTCGAVAVTPSQSAELTSAMEGMRTTIHPAGSLLEPVALTIHGKPHRLPPRRLSPVILDFASDLIQDLLDKQLI